MKKIFLSLALVAAAVSWCFAEPAVTASSPSTNVTEMGKGKEDLKPVVNPKSTKSTVKKHKKNKILKPKVEAAKPASTK